MNIFHFLCSDINALQKRNKCRFVPAAIYKNLFLRRRKTMQKRNKKGFTLAELLIVVAIIAILVAIAVPLFVSSLNDAKEATKNANIRTVRSTAAVAILRDAQYETHKTNGWKAVACITKTSEIKSMTITADDAGGKNAADECKEHSGSESCGCSEDTCDCAYQVTVHITTLDLDKVTVTG